MKTIANNEWIRPLSFRTHVSPSTSSGTGINGQWACRTAQSLSLLRM